jgi:putative spermidine/putrescine transport system permease protein
MATDISLQETTLTTPSKKRRSGPVRIALAPVVLVLVLLYLLVPLVSTFVFSLSGGRTINLSAYTAFLNDPDFYRTFLLSLQLSLAATLLTIILVTPTAYWVQTRLPVGRPIMDVLTLLPFAVPAIIMALGKEGAIRINSPVVNSSALQLRVH